MHTALTIAGSDSGGGAGIQADIKTMTVHGVFAMCAVTALTAQNTTGVYGIMEVSGEFLAKQLDCVFTDIFPDAVKIGMLPSEDLIHVTAQKLKEYNAKNIVLDPVMVSTSGSDLMRAGAASIMKEALFPLAAVVTPNIPEAQVLSGMSIESTDDMQSAARKIYEQCGVPVLVKGGHLADDLGACDILFDGKPIRIHERRIDNPNTHGTGCTLSSAIAANLANGCDLLDAVTKAKEYVTGAIAAGLDLGKGSGPLNHTYALQWQK